MNLTQKIAIAAGTLTLGAAGVAAAATATPDVADPGLTKASEQVGVELPASSDSHPEATDEATQDETGDVGEQDATEDNHGDAVSAVAHTEFDTGREHGEAVSAIARTNEGTEATDEVSDDAGEEADDGVSDEATEHEAEQSTAGSDNSGEHGTP